MNIHYLSADKISIISIFQKHKNIKLDSLLVLAKHDPDIIEIRFATEDKELVTLVYKSLARATEFLNAALSASWFRIILPTDKVEVGKDYITVTGASGVPITYHETNNDTYEELHPWMKSVMKPIHLYGYTFLYWNVFCAVLEDVDGNEYELKPWNVCFEYPQKSPKEEQKESTGSSSQGPKPKESTLHELLSFWEDKGTMIKEKQYGEGEEDDSICDEICDECREDMLSSWTFGKSMFSGLVSPSLYLYVYYANVLSIRQKGRKLLIEEDESFREYKLDTKAECTVVFDALISALERYHVDREAE